MNLRAPTAVWLYALTAPIALLQGAAIDLIEGWYVALPLISISVLIGIGLVRAWRTAWVLGLGLALLAGALVGFLFDRYASSPTVPGTTVYFWSTATSWLIGYTVIGLVLLWWPSTLRWVWHRPRSS